MSVLFLRRLQARELWRPCDNGCVTYANHRCISNRGRTDAQWEAYLVGRHCAWLCERCAKGWRSWWPTAGGCVPVVDGRRDARAFEEAA